MGPARIGRDFLKQKRPAEALHILLFALGALFLSLLPWALYMFQYGRRILKTGQFPPAGAKVMRDTEIIEGEPARRKARILIGLSLFIAVLALLGSLYLPYKLSKLFDVKKMDQQSHGTLKTDPAENRRIP